jgi:hypothetical protein
VLWECHVVGRTMGVCVGRCDAVRVYGEGKGREGGTCRQPRAPLRLTHNTQDGKHLKRFCLVEQRACYRVVYRSVVSLLCTPFLRTQS